MNSKNIINMFNNTKSKSLPIVATSDIDTVKIEKLYNYFGVKDINLKDVLFVGHQSDLAKKMINNLNVSKNLIQNPDSLGVGKLASFIMMVKF